LPCRCHQTDETLVAETEEKERLEREKINSELQLLKAQIHPGMLFNNVIIFIRLHGQLTKSTLYVDEIV